jgi:uncharacterized protein (TIGR03435 family)
MRQVLAWNVLRVAVIAGACCCTAALGAQPGAAPEWQVKAGGKMEFEVASVRQDKGPFQPPSFALSADDWFREPNGRFHADFPLTVYIQFAYKLWPTQEEQRVMLTGLPSWVKDDRYAIEATAPLHATKDQYRLMMQALLAERFQLKLHVENKEMAVLAMTLIKPGKPGPKLIPHEQRPSCDAPATADLFPEFCYGFMATRPTDGMVKFGSRGSPMDLIGRFLGSTGGMTGELARPVVDQTGLSGRWDFTLEAASPFGDKPAEGAPSNGPMVLEAMQEQLGLRLKPAKAVIPVIVIDHVERPSEN